MKNDDDGDVRRVHARGNGPEPEGDAAKWGLVLLFRHNYF